MFSWTWWQYPKISFIYFSTCFARVCPRGFEGNIPKSPSCEYIFPSLFVLQEYVLVDLMAISENLLHIFLNLFCKSMSSWIWRQYPKISFMWVYISQLICYARICSRGLDGNIRKSQYISQLVLQEYVLVDLKAISQNLLHMIWVYISQLICFARINSRGLDGNIRKSPSYISQLVLQEYVLVDLKAISQNISFMWVYISQLICFARMCSRVIITLTVGINQTAKLLNPLNPVY